MDRRKFIRNTGAGVFTFWVGGCEKELTPAAARQAGADLRVFTPDQAATLEMLADVFVPGSREKGLAHFVDLQLAAPAAEQLLMIRYLGVPAPFFEFYRAGIAAADTAAQNKFATSIAELAQPELDELAALIASGEVDDWQGPPAGFFYFVLRADAVDVVYGTRQGFADLGIPYMPHIQPSSDWGVS